MPLVEHPNIHNTLPFSKTHLLMLVMERADKQKRLPLFKQSRPFSKTHLLMLAMERTDKERNRLSLVKHPNIHNT